MTFSDQPTFKAHAKKSNYNTFLTKLRYSSSTSPSITDALQHSTATKYIIRDHIHSVWYTDQSPLLYKSWMQGGNMADQ